jgi:hypothetical protein
MKNEIEKVRKYTILYYKRTEDRLTGRFCSIYDLFQYIISYIFILSLWELVFFSL